MVSTPKTLREYLTLRNPIVNRSKLPSGRTSSNSGSVGPDKIVKWSGFCLLGMERRIADVLNQYYEFKAVEVPVILSRSLRPIGEPSLRGHIHEQWTEKIMQKALEATTHLLKDKEGWGFCEADVFYESNKGHGNISRPLVGNKKLRDWEPDWYCCQCFGKDVYSQEDNVPLLYGDTKTSGTFKSEWIGSSQKTDNTKAQKTLEQVTRYMASQDLQYGFILTDAEVVALKMSKYPRDSQYTERSAPLPEAELDIQDLSVQSRQPMSALESIRNATIRYITAIETAPAFEAEVRDVRSIRTTRPDDNYHADAKIDVYIEYAAVAWKEYGKSKLTVNLAIWWLIMLATEGRLAINHQLKEPSSNQNSQEAQESTHQAGPQHWDNQNIEDQRTHSSHVNRSRARQATTTRLRRSGTQAGPSTIGPQIRDETQDARPFTRRQESQTRKRQRDQTPELDDDTLSSTQQAKIPRRDNESFSSRRTRARQRSAIGSYVEPDSEEDDYDTLYMSFSVPAPGGRSLSRQSSGIRA